MSAGKQNRISSAYTMHNRVRLVRAGSEYFNLLLEIIAKAEETIHLQTYIIDDDETGRQVKAALLEAAKRGVKVYVVADAYASNGLPKHFVKELEDGGIQFRFFQPFFKSKHFYIGRRMHHKLIVADTKHCMVGGINIGNRYNDTAAGSAWLDFALYAEGQIARQVCLLACKTWKGFFLKDKLPTCVENQFQATGDPGENMLVRLRQNDWVSSKNQISKTYKEMLTTAQTKVVFLCSYFMPGNLMKRNILRAVRRGVQVKVIMGGLSDVPMAKNAERFMYDWLLRNNIEIYEYQKNVLHGKLAACDSKWMTIGSYNVNNISAYASVELNLDVNDAAFTKHVEEVLSEIIANDCLPVTKEQLAKTKNIFKQFINWCSYEFIRFMFYLFTFYFRQRKN